MSSGVIIAIVIVLVLLAAAATLLLHRVALRRRFGTEYDRLASEVGPRRAQADLTERQRRVARMNIRPLSGEQRDRYNREWTSAEERFVDSPARAVQAAAALTTAAAADRGYPASDHTQLLADLSVHHARWIDGYRQARQTTERAGTASTEELREAVLGYRGLFRDLLGSPDSGAGKPAVEGGSAVAGAKVAGPAPPDGTPSTETGTDGDREDQVAAPRTRRT